MHVYRKLGFMVDPHRDKKYMPENVGHILDLFPAVSDIKVRFQKASRGRIGFVFSRRM